MYICMHNTGFPSGSAVKNLPAMQETWVQSPGWEETLEKEMATHSSTLAWRIPWTEEPSGLQSIGSQRVRHDGAITLTLTNLTSWGFCFNKRNKTSLSILNKGHLL